MLRFRCITLVASVLFLLVHQLVPHHHDHFSVESHFCAEEQPEPWSRLVWGLSLDMGQDHLESFRTPEPENFDVRPSGAIGKLDSSPGWWAYDDFLGAHLWFAAESAGIDLKGRDRTAPLPHSASLASAGRAPPTA